ncbi:MAG: cytochrome c-type biogenesis protein CcmH, partial [Dehalococcoidales bacterium]
AQKIDQGQSEEQIIQFFVAQYGEQVLAAPPKRGFNLMAWITPFVALIVGAGVIYIALKKWVRREALSRTYTPAELDEEDEEYRRQLEEELKEFSERSYR